MGRIVNQRALAEILGVSQTTTTTWATTEGMPVRYRAVNGGENRCDTAEVIEWLVRRAVHKACIETAKDRLARLQGDKVEIEIDEARGHLVPVERIEPAWSAMVDAAKSFLRAQPDRLAAELDATADLNARRELLADTFDEFLEKLAGYGADEDAADAADAPDHGAVGAAAQADGGAVGRALPVPVE